MNPGFTYKESIDQSDQLQLPLNPENDRERKTRTSANSETPRERSNRLRRERRASLSAAKEDAAAQLRHDHGSLRQEERDENLSEPINQEEAMVTGGDQDLQEN